MKDMTKIFLVVCLLVACGLIVACMVLGLASVAAGDYGFALLYLFFLVCNLANIFNIAVELSRAE